MKIKFECNTLTIYLSGRIDAGCAAVIENEITEALKQYPDSTLVFDAEGLKRISSAGLRVLLKFSKQSANKPEIINASKDVYDIFDVTGFTELFNVRKKLREISLDGLEVIGVGISATVYRLNPETIVKVFNNNQTLRHFPLSKIENDRRISREVFLHDIPTAIPFDVVKAGEFYGIVYEMIEADSMSGVLRKHPERLNELSLKAAKLLKKFHATEFDEGTFRDARWYPHDMTRAIYEKGFISSEDRTEIDELIDRIPYRNTFVHCDFHPNNLLVRDDELIIIDVGEAGQGNPIIDLLISFGHFVYLPRLSADEGHHIHEKIIGLNADMLKASWDIMLPEYLGIDDKAAVKKYEEVISKYASIIIMAVLQMNPRKLPHDELQKTINKVMIPFRDSIKTLKPIEGI